MNKLDLMCAMLLDALGPGASIHEIPEVAFPTLEIRHQSAFIYWTVEEDKSLMYLSYVGLPGITLSTEFESMNGIIARSALDFLAEVHANIRVRFPLSFCSGRNLKEVMSSWRIGDDPDTRCACFEITGLDLSSKRVRDDFIIGRKSCNSPNGHVYENTLYGVARLEVPAWKVHRAMIPEGSLILSNWEIYSVAVRHSVSSDFDTQYTVSTPDGLLTIHCDEVDAVLEWGSGSETYRTSYRKLGGVVI